MSKGSVFRFLTLCTVGWGVLFTHSMGAPLVSATEAPLPLSQSEESQRPKKPSKKEDRKTQSSQASFLTSSSSSLLSEHASSSNHAFDLVKHGKPEWFQQEPQSLVNDPSAQSLYSGSYAGFIFLGVLIFILVLALFILC